MMNSRQQEEDERRAIEAYTGDSKFQNLLKNILNKGTGKKVDNFLDGQKLAPHYFHSIDKKTYLLKKH